MYRAYDRGGRGRITTRGDSSQFKTLAAAVTHEATQHIASTLSELEARTGQISETNDVTHPLPKLCLLFARIPRAEGKGKLDVIACGMLWLRLRNTHACVVQMDFLKNKPSTHLYSVQCEDNFDNINKICCVYQYLLFIRITKRQEYGDTELNVKPGITCLIGVFYSIK